MNSHTANTYVSVPRLTQEQLAQAQRMGQHHYVRLYTQQHVAPKARAVAASFILDVLEPLRSLLK